MEGPTEYCYVHVLYLDIWMKFNVMSKISSKQKKSIYEMNTVIIVITFDILNLLWNKAQTNKDFQPKEEIRTTFCRFFSAETFSAEL